MKRENWLFKVIMVIVITSLVITMIGCQPAEPKPSNDTGDVPISASSNATEPDPTGEPTCRWGEWQEVSTWDDGGYFLPKDMIEDYVNGTLEQWVFYNFIVSPSIERGVKEGLDVRLQITDGGPHVSSKNGEFYIHPDDQARLDQGEQPEKIWVLWIGHVPSLEEKWGRLANADGESPNQDWIAFRFRVIDIYYGYLPELVVRPTGRVIRKGFVEQDLSSLTLP